jgi:hypothetical protein
MDQLQYWWLLCAAKCDTRKLLLVLVPENLCSSHRGLDHLQYNLECVIFIFYTFFCVAISLVTEYLPVILIIDSTNMSVCWLRKSLSWWILLTMTVSKMQCWPQILCGIPRKPNKLLKYFLTQIPTWFECHRSDKWNIVWLCVCQKGMFLFVCPWESHV